MAQSKLPPFSKSDLIDKLVSEHTDDVPTKAAAARLVDATFAILTQGVKKHGAAVIPSFGTFTVKSRPERSGRNPATGEAIKIAASKSVGFKMRGGLKDALTPAKKPRKA